MNEAGDNSGIDLRWRRWAFPLAVLTACATFPLILLGGLVTTYEVGMAVPDAPTTFGQNMLLFPIFEWLRAPFGVFLEHGHRLFGSMVGLLTLMLAASLWADSPRRWLPWLGVIALAAAFAGGVFHAAGLLLVGSLVALVAVLGWMKDRKRRLRWLGLVAIGLVLVQGGLGALRVVLRAQEVAVIHGVVAQVFFAFIVAIAVFCTRTWWQPAPRMERPDVTRVQRLSALTTGFVLLQLVVGAMLRHLGWQWTLVAHLAVAFIVLIHMGLLAKRILIGYADSTRLVVGIEVLALLVAAQPMLGAGAWATSNGFGTGATPPNAGQVFFATSHVAVGALILTTCTTLTLWSYQFLVQSSRPARGSSRDRLADRRAEPAMRPTVSALESRELLMARATL